MRSGLLLSALLTMTCLSSSEVAATGNWPEHTVRVIVPFPAGGAVDIAARVLAEGLTKRWKQPVVVENRPGGETRSVPQPL